MKNIKILILLLLLIFSCNPQESNGHKKENPILKIEYNFYASSGGEPIYRVLYCDKEVIVENLEHSHTYKGKITKDKITKDKIEEIESIISKLKPNNDIETDIILDSWRIELIINGITYYNKTEVTKETLPKDIRQLLYILIKNSTVDIDLYDFS
jgi:lipoprotein